MSVYYVLCYCQILDESQDDNIVRKSFTHPAVLGDDLTRFGHYRGLEILVFCPVMQLLFPSPTVHGCSL